MLVTIIISLGVLILLARRSNMFAKLDNELAVYLASGLFILSAVLIFIANCTTYSRVPFTVHLYNDEFKVSEYSNKFQYRISLSNGQDMIIDKSKVHEMSRGDEESIEIHGVGNYYSHEGISTILYALIYLTTPEIEQSNIYTEVYWVKPK